MNSKFDYNKTWRYGENRSDVSGIRFLAQNLFGPERYDVQVLPGLE